MEIAGNGLLLNKNETRRRKAHLKDDWISSSVLPFVSGTQRVTNTIVKALTSMQIVKVPVECEGRLS